jgi:hypothetical protein
VFELGYGVGVFVAEGVEGLGVGGDVAAEANTVLPLVAVSGAQVGVLETDADAVADGEDRQFAVDGCGVEGEGWVMSRGVGKGEARVSGRWFGKGLSPRGRRVGSRWRCLAPTWLRFDLERFGEGEGELDGG